ncbi:type II toxin-antitoxin system death-on-curing family toxin [Isoptericola sp. b408]|uniref:type II toxin-antitoxin system death-on-curing family toxin n=1 Tax=Isoptericola sp. b408 TaxID=3064653 RepID=UPI002712C018|nr:type II toxin-antitoxin system death-on-curing family toxin [Isoptericola sp. b408]MDO8150379.1 type II toxin-antitoxin system death-on-curing family toxin [Isoptericola sp. b408]
MNVIYVDETDLLAAATAFLGHPPEVRDMGLLSSACARPRAGMYGTEAYPGIHQKAAALLMSLVKNHSLIDGNKRLGWVGVRLFYLYNGHDLRMREDDAYDLVMSIADGTQADLPKVARILSDHTN